MAYKTKQDMKQANARYHERNKENPEYRAKRRQIQQQLRKRNMKFLKEYLATHPCIDCGFSDVRALEFDHVRGQKFKEVALMAQVGYSIEKLKVEIDKCEVRCANCHKIITAERRVSAINNAGTGNPSNEASITTNS